MNKFDTLYNKILTETLQEKQKTVKKSSTKKKNPRDKRYDPVSGKYYTPRKMPSEAIDEDKQRLDPKCWKGYRQQGTKMKDGVRVNNCVKIKK